MTCLANWAVRALALVLVLSAVLLPWSLRPSLADDARAAALAEHPGLIEALDNRAASAALDILERDFGGNPAKDREGVTVLLDVLEELLARSAERPGDAALAADLARSFDRAHDWVVTGSSDFDLALLLRHQAFVMATRSTQLAPDDPDLRILRCKLAIKAAEIGAAEEDCALALAQGFETAELHGYLSMAQEMGGKYEQALASVERARALSDTPALHSKRYRGLLARLGHYDRALEVLLRETDLAAIEADENKLRRSFKEAGFYAERGMLRALLERDDLAAADFDRAHAASMYHCDTQPEGFSCGHPAERANSLSLEAAMASFRHGQYDQALVHFDRVEQNRFTQDLDINSRFTSRWRRVWRLVAGVEAGQRNAPDTEKILRFFRRESFSIYVDDEVSEVLAGQLDREAVLAFPPYEGRYAKDWNLHRCWALAALGYWARHDDPAEARRLFETAVAEGTAAGAPCLEAKAGLRVLAGQP